jgi:hypothetical protein
VSKENLTRGSSFLLISTPLSFSQPHPWSKRAIYLYLWAGLHANQRTAVDEIMWETRPFNKEELWNEDGSQPFVYAQGDA